MDDGSCPLIRRWFPTRWASATSCSPYTEDVLADSLLTALRGGADFAQAASQYSVYDMTAANGGEVGVMPFSAFSGEFAEALAGAREGDIVKVASGDAIQLMQVYRAGKPTKHVQVASITLSRRGFGRDAPQRAQPGRFVHGERQGLGRSIRRCRVRCFGYAARGRDLTG